MTVTQSDIIIQQYKEAYFDLYGIYAEVRRNGSWVYLNSNSTAYRIKRDLPEFISRLKDHKKQMEEATEIVGDDISPIPIKKDLIRMLLQKFLEDSGNSGFTMEQKIKDYAMGGIPYINVCEDCYEIESLQNDLIEKDNIIYSLKNQARNLKDERDNLISDIKSMKEKSVFFSMDDLKDIVPKLKKKKPKKKKAKQKIRYFSTLPYEEEDVPF